MRILDYFLIPIIDLIGMAIVVAVLAKDIHSKQNRLFSYLVISILGWVTFASLSDYTTGEVSLLLNRLVFFSLAILAPVLIHFSFTFPENSKYNKFTVVTAYVLGFILGLLSLFTGQVVGSISIQEFGTSLNTGMAYYLLLGFLFISFIASTTVFVSKYFKSTGQKRSQLQFFFMGLFLVVAINLVVYYIVRPIVGSDKYYRFGNYAVIIFILSTAYSIVARKLFEIRVVLVSVLVVVINIFLLAQTFISTTLSERMIEGTVCIVVAIGSVLLVKSVYKEIERRKEVEELIKERMIALKELEQRNKNLATLQKVSDIVLNEVDFKSTAQKLLDEIPKQIDDCAGAFLATVKNGHLTACAFSSRESTKKIQGFVGIDLEKYSSPIEAGYSALHKTLVGNKATESEKLEDYLSPPLGKTVSRTLQALLGIKYVTALPLYAHGEPLGVMVFGFKERKEDVSEKVIEVTNAISSDMSLALQRAAAFQKLKDANEYLSQLDKMKDEFISMASHELNTPLAAIEGYMSMILDEHMGKVDDKAKEYLGRAFASSKRLASLISDLLNVSRIEQGRLKMSFSEVDIKDLAESVINELQVKSEAKKLYLKVESAAGVPKTWCDPDRIREVLVNLSGNAIKFTEKGGITIKIEPIDQNIRISVIDTGRGIAEEDKKKLFQKFSQVHREVDEHQGTGLGLYISKNFVELHKGKIWVESDGIGKGTRFVFELPVTKEPPKAVDGAILDGPLSAPQIVKADGQAPDIVTQSVSGKM